MTRQQIDLNVELAREAWRDLRAVADDIECHLATTQHTSLSRHTARGIASDIRAALDKLSRAMR